MKSNDADVACQLEAREVGLHGSYVALLSTKQRTLKDIVSQQQQHLPVVNTKVRYPVHEH